MGVRTIGAGNLDQRVTLQQRDASLNTLGQASDTWTNVAEVWARVEPLKGREFFAAGQMQSEATTRITIRYLAGVTERNRVLWRGQPYDISAVIEPDGHKQTLELMAVAGVRDGR